MASLKSLMSRVNKQVLILMLLFAVAAGATAQLKILPNGNVGIKTNNPTKPLDVAGTFLVWADGQVRINAATEDWWPAIRTTVPTKYSCAYNLWNTHWEYKKDVFYVRGDGLIVTIKGVYVLPPSSQSKDITPIEGALKDVLSLNGVIFKEGGDGNEEESEGGNYRLGFLPEELETIFPEAVITLQDSTKAMSYTVLISTPKK